MIHSFILLFPLSFVSLFLGKGTVLFSPFDLPCRVPHRVLCLCRYKAAQDHNAPPPKQKRELSFVRSMASSITRCSHHHRSLLALSLLLLVLFLSVSTAKKQEKNVGDDVDLAGSALINWLRASGGHSDGRVGLVVDAPAGAEPTSTRTKNNKRRRKRGQKESSSSALRGTIATRDIAEGEVIIRLPSNMSVPLGGTGVTSPVRRKRA